MSPESAKSFRVDDDLWQAAQAKARSEGRIVSHVLREALREYVKDWPESED